MADIQDESPTHEEPRLTTSEHLPPLRDLHRPTGTAEPGFDVSALQREIAELREALVSRAVIDQAKGALMLLYGIDADRAFGVLRRWSQESNVKLHTVALVFVQAICMGEQVTTVDPALVRWLEQQLRGAVDAKPHGQPATADEGGAR
jgi:hypothetical protein